MVFFFNSALPMCAKAQSWKVVTSGTDTNLRGVSAVASKDWRSETVWAVGSNGAVLISTDTGKKWTRLSVQDGAKLDFRGIVAFNEQTAYLMASGEGEKSRIYKTSDGGTNWRMQFTDKRKEFFLDAIACLSDTECYALGDPLDGRFLVLRTKDGEHWERLTTESLEALPQEGAFAASNSCLGVDRDEGIHFVTGGPAARVFHSSDFGQTWSVKEVPIAKGDASSGAFSIAVDAKRVVIVGGDYRNAERGGDSAAYSTDGGANWKRAAGSPGGFRSAVVSVDGLAFLSVGTNGSSFSTDGGVHWKPAGSTSLNALVRIDPFVIWGVGANGTIAKFHNPLQYEIKVSPNASSETAEVTQVAPPNGTHVR